jgi:hypothetical protein
VCATGQAFGLDMTDEMLARTRARSSRRRDRRRRERPEVEGTFMSAFIRARKPAS